MAESPNEKASAASRERSLDDEIFLVRWITYNNRKLPVVMQSANGPCPLLVLSNVLLLRGNFRLDPETQFVSATDLIMKITDCLLSNVSPKMNDEERANRDRNVQDVLENAFPKLHTGIDMNVRFKDPWSFELTLDMMVFELLDVPLLHGWLVDPEDKPTYKAVYNRTYNELVDLVISCDAEHSAATATKTAERTAETSRPEVSAAKQFLQDSASQLTVYGLSQLHAVVKERELCAFFRNNHFCTLTKRNGRLYVLTTDAGFVDTNIVWQTLADDTDFNAWFADENFKLLDNADDRTQREMSQKESDMLMALLLQMQEPGFAVDQPKLQALKAEYARRTGQPFPGDSASDGDKAKMLADGFASVASTFMTLTPRTTPTPTVTPVLKSTATVTPGMTSVLKSTATVTPTPTVTPVLKSTTVVTPAPTVTPILKSTTAVTPAPTVTPVLKSTTAVTPGMTPTTTVTPGMTPRMTPTTSVTPAAAASVTVTPSNGGPNGVNVQAEPERLPSSFMKVTMKKRAPTVSNSNWISRL